MLNRGVGSLVSGLLADARDDAVDELMESMDFELVDEIAAVFEPPVEEETTSDLERLEDEGFAEDMEAETEDIHEDDGTCWTYAAAAELTEFAFGMATRQLAKEIPPSISATSRSACSSLRVNIGEEYEDNTVEDTLRDAAWADFKHDLGTFADEEDALSVSSDGSWEERHQASEAVQSMRVALRLVNDAVEQGFTDEFAEANPAETASPTSAADRLKVDDGDGTSDFVEDAGSAGSAIHEPPLSPDEFAFDFVSGLLDESLCNIAGLHSLDDAPQDTVESIDRSSGISCNDTRPQENLGRDEGWDLACKPQVCSRPSFARVLCPRRQRAPTLAQALSTEKLMSQPLVLTPPALKEIDWSLWTQADSTAAGSASPSSEQTPAKPGDERAEPGAVSATVRGEWSAQDASAGAAIVASAPMPTMATQVMHQELRSSSSSRVGTSSRSKRRIIGGIVRLPAAAEARDVGAVDSIDDIIHSVLAAGPGEGSQPLSSSSNLGKRHKREMQTPPHVPSYRMDIGDAAGFPKHAFSAPSRESSLVRGYDALGVELHSLDARDAEDFSTTRRRHLPPVSPPVRSQPQRWGELESSRRLAAGLGTPLRAASALALDLGEDAPRGSRFAAGSPWLGKEEGLTNSRALRSTSLGALRLTKTAQQKPTFEVGQLRKAAGMLPTLPGHSAGSVAWSVHMARRGPQRQRSVGAIS